VIRPAAFGEQSDFTEKQEAQSTAQGKDVKGVKR
jgi:hypothetical protein